ncbi:MAG: class I SAM-dependent methyltransferase [Cyanobacteria bacterium J06555_13]
MRKKLRAIYSRYIAHKNKPLIASQNDILATQFLAPLQGEYLPWSNSSIRPSAMVSVINDVVIGAKQTILECGGGISSFYIARALKESGSGMLYTVEDNLEWAKFLERRLEQEQLADFSKVIYAPLVSSTFNIESSVQGLWYDTNPIKGELADRKIDTLLVDGPGAYTRETRFSRYPAVPFFSQFFSNEYTIFLDDINRPGEQKIVEKWEEELSINFDRRLLNGNIAIGRPHSAFKI